MKVWRVEHKKYKRGPYRLCEVVPEKSCESIGIPGYSCDNKPMPYNDGINNFESGSNQSVRFGFESLTKLKDWFSDDELKSLKRHGFVVNVYSVPRNHVQVGGRQVLFRKRQSRFSHKSRAI